VRYYGLYSNKSRGMAAKTGRRRPEMTDALRPEPRENSPSGTLFILPAPEPRSGRALRPLWRDLIMRVWCDDPHKCPCCPSTMRAVGTMIRRSEVEFFLKLHGLWEPEAEIDCRQAGSPKGGAPATSTSHCPPAHPTCRSTSTRWSRSRCRRTRSGGRTSRSSSRIDGPSPSPRGSRPS